MAKLALAVILAVFFTNQTSANEYENADWILVSDEDGVEVYTADIESSDIRGVKGIFTMPYNCAYVFSVIMDNKRALTWVDRLISSEIIDEKNPYSQTVYVAMDTPFPFVDREFVYNREYTFDDENDTIFVKIVSVDREIKGSRRLRATIHHSSQRFVSQDDGEACLVESQTHADPGGYIPAWVVNMYQVDWPMNTSLALKEELKKGPSKIHPKVSNGIDEALEIDSSSYADLALNEK